MQKDEKNATIPNELLHFLVAGKEICVTLTQDQIWLVASDVAEVLGYRDTNSILDSLDSNNTKNQ